MTSPGSNGFDRLAAIYDPLSRLVYGKRIVDAQTCFLDSIDPGSKVLILGGGTGWLLKELLRRRPTCSVWYIESSIGMLQRAIKSNEGAELVHFIQGDERDIPNQGFDAVITHFVLDLYEAGAMERLIRKILIVSKPSVRWLVSDFVDNGRWWQQFMLSLMYIFFRWTCGIEIRILPRWQEVFVRCGLSPVGEHEYYGGFIASKLYTYIR